MSPEAFRILFLIQRDGEGAARRWAAEVARDYRKTLLLRKAGMYRRRMIESCLDLRRFGRGGPIPELSPGVTR